MEPATIGETTYSVLRIMSSPRAVKILDELLSRREGMSLTEIAKKTRVGIQETHYILGRLTSLGLVSRVSGRNYTATMLGSGVMREIIEIARLTEESAHLSKHLPLMENMPLAKTDWEIVRGLNTVLAHIRRILSTSRRVSILSEEPVNMLVVAGVDPKTVGGRLLYIGGSSEIPPKLIRESEELANLEIGYIWTEDYMYEIVAGEGEGLVFHKDLLGRIDHENALLLRGVLGMYFINSVFERFWQGARRPPSMLARR
ncbi:MAG: helix-turn-helix domain-containing protein [Nitrososphaerota archaeon]